MRLKEKTIGGLHDHLDRYVLGGYAAAGGRALDLAAGSGALTRRLRRRGLDVTAADIDEVSYAAEAPFVRIDLDQPDFAGALPRGPYDLVTAVEVIEHLESPVAFLRNVRRLLAPGAVAVVTTPNVDSLPARLRHLLSGELHMFDRRVPWHVTPVFFDLFTRVYLRRAELSLVAHSLYPTRGYRVSRRHISWLLGAVARALPGVTLLGDVHIFVVRAASAKNGATR